MSTHFDVRFYESGDEYGIVDLLKIAFPFWANLESPIDYWKWRYLDTYYGCRVMVAISDKKIIGVDHSMFQQIKICDSVYNSTFGAESATHPNYRKIGVYSKILKLIYQYRLENNFRFSYYNSENPIVIKDAEKKKRSIFPFPMSQMTRMKNTSQIDSLTKRFGFITLKMLNNITNSLIFDSKTGEDFIIVEISKFDDDVNRFYEQIRLNYDFIIEKNQGYLNWRYCDPRGGKYIIYKAVRDGKFLGFVVLELRKSGNGFAGSIADLMVLPGEDEVVKAFFKTACDYFDELGVNAINYGVVKGHPYQRISSRFGFLDSSMISKMLTLCRFEQIESEYDLLKSSSSDKIFFNLGDVFLH